MDALKESTPDVSAQINEHNVAEDAHANRFANYLPLSGGTITGELVIGNEKNIAGTLTNAISFSKAPNTILAVDAEGNSEAITIGIYNEDGGDSLTVTNNTIFLYSTDVKLRSSYTPASKSSVVNKKYVDEKIAAIPTPDVSAQIEAHNTSAAAHANMHWLTADDEMLSSIDPDGSIDADTLESHPASDFVLKSELSTLVPAPDLTNYYTKAQVDEKITQIQQLIDQAAALVDEINGEVI